MELRADLAIKLQKLELQNGIHMPTDCTQNFVDRRWTKTKSSEVKESVPISILHWNMLAQRLCDGFDKMDDASPILKFENRLRLMKQHLAHVDCDIVGMSEVDAISGKCN